VGFRAPRELKQRLEAAAVRSGRSLSTEAQIRLERSFEKQDLLGNALELAYGSRFGGVLLLAAEMAAEVGRLAGYISGESHAAILNWIDDPFAYDQAVITADLILNAFRPHGDRHLLQKSGKQTDLRPAMRAMDALTALRDPEGVQQRIKEMPLASFYWEMMKINPELDEKLRRLLGPLIERIRYTTEGDPKDA
jgi:hypothetical protein